MGFLHKIRFLSQKDTKTLREEFNYTNTWVWNNLKSTDSAIRKD